MADWTDLLTKNRIRTRLEAPYETKEFEMSKVHAKITRLAAVLLGTLIILGCPAFHYPDIPPEEKIFYVDSNYKYIKEDLYFITALAEVDENMQVQGGSMIISDDRGAKPKVIAIIVEDGVTLKVTFDFPNRKSDSFPDWMAIDRGDMWVPIYFTLSYGEKEAKLKIAPIGIGSTAIEFDFPAKYLTSYESDPDLNLSQDRRLRNMELIRLICEAIAEEVFGPYL